MKLSELQKGKKVYRLMYVECSEGWGEYAPITDKVKRIEYQENKNVNIYFERGNVVYTVDDGMDIPHIYKSKKELYKGIEKYCFDL